MILPNIKVLEFPVSKEEMLQKLIFVRLDGLYLDGHNNQNSNWIQILVTNLTELHARSNPVKFGRKCTLNIFIFKHVQTKDLQGGASLDYKDIIEQFCGEALCNVTYQV